jgi:hypothetical protein
MKIEIESTEIVTALDGVACRLWKGITHEGIECQVFVHRIAVHVAADSSAFDRELTQYGPPDSFRQLC